MAGRSKPKPTQEESIHTVEITLNKIPAEEAVPIITAEKYDTEPPTIVTEAPPAHSLLIDAEKSYEEAEHDLICFVEKKVAQMNESLLFKGEDSPRFADLNRALMEYESVMLGLLSMHQETRFKSQVAQERYDNFYAEKYVEIRNREIAAAGLSSAKTKPLAAKEIELLVRHEYLAELAALKAEAIKAENEYNYLNHLMESWKNYQFVLSTLSRNAQAEAGASGVALNNPYDFG